MLKKNKIDNNNAAEKGCHIAEDIVNAIIDKRSDKSEPLKSYPHLENCLNENKYSEKLIEKLSNKDNYKIPNQNRKRDVERLVNILEKERLSKQGKRSNRHKGLKIMLPTTIAAALIAISFAVWYSNNSSLNYKDIVGENGISTSKITTPVIILGNSEKISPISKINQLKTEKYKIKQESGNKITYTNDNTSENKSSVNTELNTIIVPKMCSFSVMLSDGTEVKINANSRLTFPAVFTDSLKREVILEGEAFFKVSKGKIPFIVNGRDMNVKVYGTEFNVISRVTNSETVLVSGSVGVTSEGNDEIFIKPNQRYTYNSKNKEEHVDNVDVASYISWLDNQFMVDKIPLSKFIEQIENWYGVKFSFTNEITKNKTITLALSREITIAQLLSIIERGTDIKIINEGGDKYTIE